MLSMAQARMAYNGHLALTTDFRQSYKTKHNNIISAINNKRIKVLLFHKAMKEETNRLVTMGKVLLNQP